MSDNTEVTPGSGATVAADDVDGALHQRVKISVGADGSAADWEGEVAIAADPTRWHVNHAFSAAAQDHALRDAVAGKRLCIDQVIASSGEAGKWWLEEDTAATKAVVYGPHWVAANGGSAPAAFHSPIKLSPEVDLGVTSETTTKLALDIFGHIEALPAMPTLRDAHVATGTSSIVIVKPTGLTVGDYMLLFGGSDYGASTTLTPPTGFTQLQHSYYGSNPGLYCWGKVADESDAAASDFTITKAGSSSLLQGCLMAFSGCSGVDVSAAAAAASDYAFTIAGGLTPAVSEGTLVLCACTQGGGDTSFSAWAAAAGGPTSWTEDWDYAAGGASMGVAHGVRYAGTPTGALTVSASVSNPYVLIGVLLKA
jgi:hypothetical protein